MLLLKEIDRHDEVLVGASKTEISLLQVQEEPTVTTMSRSRLELAGAARSVKEGSNNVVAFRSP